MSRLHVNKPLNGFTLTEGIITILLVGIIATISTPSFLHWLNQKKVDAALNQVLGAIKETQSEAIKRNQSCSITLPNALGPTLTGTCLVTGNRSLDSVQLSHNKGAAPWDMTFDFDGNNKNASDAGVLSLSIPGSNVQSRCIVISQGIGLLRTGKMNGALSAANCKTD